MSWQDEYQNYLRDPKRESQLLLEAILHDDVEGFKNILNLSNNNLLEHKDILEQTQLHKAAFLGKRKVLMLILPMVSNENFFMRDYVGKTPEMIADYYVRKLIQDEMKRRFSPEKEHHAVDKTHNQKELQARNNVAKTENQIELKNHANPDIKINRKLEIKQNIEPDKVKSSSWCCGLFNRKPTNHTKQTIFEI